MSHNTDTQEKAETHIAPAAFQIMQWAEQNDYLLPHLRWVLSTLVRPASTVHVAWALAERTGLDEKMLTRVLLNRFAKHYPGLATHDGPQYKAYGRIMRKWRWHPFREDLNASNPADGL